VQVIHVDGRCTPTLKEYFGDINDILDGKKLKINDFETQKQGIYLLNYDKFMSVIQITDDTINYTLNKVEKC